ncbi:MAG: VWA domain-containing protein [Deltaproteobacteria bacterium]|jgi:Mg-chelatase subunit ChlD|nr:VWA domain-containing protein [Deltaproteobacteria bacterium]
MNKKPTRIILDSRIIVLMLICLMAVGCAAMPAEEADSTAKDTATDMPTERAEERSEPPAAETWVLKSGGIPEDKIAAGSRDEKPAAPPSTSESEKKPSRKKAGRPMKKISSGLKAGVSDDNTQFNYFLNFLEKFRQVPHIPIDVRERIILKVKDVNGKSIPNAGVSIYHGNDKIEAGKTFADGSYLFFPSVFKKKPHKFSAEIVNGQDHSEVVFKRDGRREIEVNMNSERVVSPRIAVDIVFILDTTGSMGEEINRLKKTIEIINLNLSSLSSRPLVRFGMVLYRDQQDDYVTSVIPLTADLELFTRKLYKVYAGGGGDNPEDLQSALHDALKKIEWNHDGIRIGFVITDAPPHLDYGQKYTYARAAADAKSAGIKLFTIGTGGLNVAGEYVLRQIAQYTYAKYIFLTYGEKGESEGGRPGSVSHHTGANYQTDKLEAIIIRLAKEEISHLTEQPIAPSDDYSQAQKIDEETTEETLQILFDRAVAQLVDYSAIAIPDNTPASVIPIGVTVKGLSGNAEYFSQQLLFSFSRNPLFKTVERQDLQKILKELEIQHTGLVDEENAVEVGRMLGAKMIITGKMLEKETSYVIFLKLVQIETAEILSITKLLVDKRLGITG